MTKEQAEEVLGIKPGELDNLAKCCASAELVTDIVSVAYNRGMVVAQAQAVGSYRIKTSPWLELFDLNPQPATPNIGGQHGFGAMLTGRMG